MTGDHLILHRMQTRLISQSFYCYDMHISELAERHNAGIDGFKLNVSIFELTHHHCAGTAVSGSAAFLGTRQSTGTQVLQGSPVGGFIDLDSLLVDH